jgi:hypothetical protein
MACSVKPGSRIRREVSGCRRGDDAGVLNDLVDGDPLVGRMRLADVARPVEDGRCLRLMDQQSHIRSVGRAHELGRHTELLRMGRLERRKRRKFRVNLDGIELPAVPLDLRWMLTEPRVTLRRIGQRRAELPAHLRRGHADRDAHATLTLEFVRHGRGP